MAPRKGDRVTYQGRSGTIVETKSVTPGMVDLRLDGDDFTRRAPATAFSNPKETVGEQIRRSRSGVFTRPDPPRFGRDGTSFCGNPIDGTAYYIAVSGRVSQPSHFITWQMVLDQATISKKGLPAPEILVEDKLKYTRGRRALLDLVRDEVYNLYPTLSAQELQIILDMVNAGVRLSHSEIDPDSRTIAGIEYRPDSTEPWEFVPERMSKISAGNQLRIVVPTPNTIKAANRAYGSISSRLSRSRKVQIIMHRQKHRSFSKIKQTAKARKGRGGGPRISQLRGVTGRPDVTYEADPGINYAKIENDQIVYPRVLRKTTPGPEYLKAFQAYARQGYTNKTGEDLPVEEALSILSQRAGVYRGRGIPDDVIQELIDCEMVYISGKREGETRRSLFLATPDDFVESGDSVIIENTQKANSPYFSWVRTVVPEFNRNNRYSRCLSPQDKQLVEEYKEAISALKYVQRSFAKLQGVMVGLTKRSGRGSLPTWDAHQILSDWRKSTQELYRQYRFLQQNNDPSSEFDFEIETFLNDAKNMGLISKKPISSIVEEFIESARRVNLLGVSGLTFLYGDTNVHPMDDFHDLFATKKGGELAEMRNEMRIQALRSRVPVTEGDRYGTNAWEYGEVLRQAAARAGRLAGSPARRDELNAISLILSDVLKERQHGDYELLGNTDDELISLLILTMMYYSLSGYSLFGSIFEPRSPGGLIHNEIIKYDDLVADILGGKPLGTGESYTVYKTYNPVLFEMTRLYWPIRDRKDSKWGGLLAHPDVIADLDTIGRYGQGAEILQRTSYVDEDLSQIILDVVGQEAGFKLMWPWGLTTPEAEEELSYFVDAPLAYLGNLKEAVNLAAPRLISRKETGVTSDFWLYETPYIRDIVTGKEPPLDPDFVDPDGPEYPALTKLRRALEIVTGKVIYSGLTDDQLDELTTRVRPKERRKMEEEALQVLQKYPKGSKKKESRKSLAIRTRNRSGKMVQKTLDRVPYSGGVYDQSTIRLIDQILAAAKVPPGEEMYGGRHNVPYVFKDEPGPTIQPESILVKAKKKRSGLERGIKILDSMIAEIDKQLGY